MEEEEILVRPQEGGKGRQGKERRRKEKDVRDTRIEKEGGDG